MPGDLSKVLAARGRRAPRDTTRAVIIARRGVPPHSLRQTRLRLSAAVRAPKLPRLHNFTLLALARFVFDSAGLSQVMR